MIISVDRASLIQTASAIDEYLLFMKEQMELADSEVRLLETGWTGQDYQSFRNQWDKLTARDSAYAYLYEALRDYSELLCFAEEAYRKAQQNAADRANRLPRW